MMDTKAQCIAQKLIDMLEARTWRVGEKMPSIRRSARQFQTSPTTMVEAYGILTSQGWLHAKPRSGFFVRRTCQPASRSLAMPIQPKLELEARHVEPMRLLTHIAKARTNPNMVELGSALPDTTYLPHKALARIARRLLSRNTASWVELTPAKGLLALRRVLCQHMLNLGLAITPEDLLITNGATEAIHLALCTVASAGDIVALGAPAYYGFYRALNTLNLRALEIPCHAQNGLDLDTLQRALEMGIQLRAIIICPVVSNPLGACMDERSRQRLVALAHQYAFTIIEDMTYTDLCFDPTQRSALQNHTEKPAKIIRLGSLGKSLAPGYRIGWCIPDVYMDRLLTQKTALSLTSASPPQHIVAEYLHDGAYEKHLNTTRTRYEALIAQLHAKLAETLPPTARISHPRGGHLLWVELPAQINTTQLFDHCIKQGVSFTPGALFSNTNAFQSCLRLNVALQWTAKQEEALEVISQRVQQLTAV